MDLETIKRINREALRAAQESEGHSASKIDNRQMMVYAAAVVVAVLAFYLMKRHTPDLVMSTVDGKKEFDRTRAIVASVVVGLSVVLGHHLLMRD